MNIMHSVKPAVFLGVILASAVLVLVFFAGPGRHFMSPVRDVEVVIAGGETRHEITAQLRRVLGWSERDAERFETALYGIQWDAFNGAMAALLGEEFEWSEAEKEVFLTEGADMSVGGDLLIRAFAPGMYVFNTSDSPAHVAETIVARVGREHDDIGVFLSPRIDADAKERADELVRRVTSLLPDIVPLPPQDIGVRVDGDRTLLVFATTYYNQGEGNLELIADSATADIADDIDRDVFQRIYRHDGTFRDLLVGTFLWHQEHLHYHFSDFVEYALERIDADGSGEQVRGQKVTFCIRDVTRMLIDGVEPREAAYRICGKEIQGVTVGWGDTYFHTYADQNFDITDLPSGIYRLSFHANPEGRLEELTRDNNRSHAIIEIDKKAMEVRVIEAHPDIAPDFEHIHIKQDL